MEFGLNVNGVGPREGIAGACREARSGGFTSLWVGESKGFYSPLTVMPLAARHAPGLRIGTGTISPLLHHPLHIERAFENLTAAYGPRFFCGLGAGDTRYLRDAGVEARHTLAPVRECVERLRASRHVPGLPVYVGAAGPRMLRLAAEVADAVLLDYVGPRLVEWAMERARGARRVLAYGPALLLPEEPRHRRHLCKAAAFVATSTPRAALEEFGIAERVDALRESLERDDPAGISRHREFLREWFAIAGEPTRVEERVRELERLGMDGVVFAIPSTHDGLSITQIQRLAKMLRTEYNMGT